MTEPKRIDTEAIRSSLLIDEEYAMIAPEHAVLIRRLLGEIDHLNNRISDLHLGCEVDDVYPGQKEAQTINQFEKL